MNIHYCDLCLQPTKDYRYILIIAKYQGRPTFDINNSDDNEDYFRKRGYMREDELEICESCYEQIQQLFKDKQSALNMLATKIEELYKKSHED